MDGPFQRHFGLPVSQSPKIRSFAIIVANPDLVMMKIESWAFETQAVP